MAVNVKSLQELEHVLRTHSKVVVHFWAAWCEPCAFLDTVLETVASDAPSLTNARVEAEEITDVAEKFGVFMVPTFLFVENGKVIDKLEGAVTAELSSKAMKLAGTGAEPSQAAFSRPAVAPAVVAEERVSDERLKELINRKHVMLFMKGTPSAPRCGFSSKVVAALRGAGADFGSFDILSDQAVRQGLKEYSNWPTYPQLYVGGELLGGCDIILEMVQTGELAQEVGMPLSVTRDAFKRMKALLAQETSKGVAHLFVLGPESVQNGDASADFVTVDVSNDRELKDAVQVFSDQVGFPQLFKQGDFVAWGPQALQAL